MERSGGAKSERAVAAAADVFLRYGFTRTTMGDIAQHAGMSRPALYLLFPDKDAVFTAVVRRMNADQLDGVRARLATLPTLKEKLLFACRTWGAHGVELTAVHPDARDLFDVSRPSVREMYAEFETFLADLLRDELAASPLQLAPEVLARVLAYAMRGFKDSAVDADDMRRLIAAQIELVVAAICARA